MAGDEETPKSFYERFDSFKLKSSDGKALFTTLGVMMTGSVFIQMGRKLRLIPDTPLNVFYALMSLMIIGFVTYDYMMDTSTNMPDVNIFGFISALRIPASLAFLSPLVAGFIGGIAFLHQKRFALFLLFLKGFTHSAMNQMLTSSKKEVEAIAKFFAEAFPKLFWLDLYAFGSGLFTMFYSLKDIIQKQIFHVVWYVGQLLKVTWSFASLSNINDVAETTDNFLRKTTSGTGAIVEAPLFYANLLKSGYLSEFYAFQSKYAIRNEIVVVDHFKQFGFKFDTSHMEEAAKLSGELADIYATVEAAVKGDVVGQAPTLLATAATALAKNPADGTPSLSEKIDKLLGDNLAEKEVIDTMASIEQMVGLANQKVFNSLEKVTGSNGTMLKEPELSTNITFTLLWTIMSLIFDTATETALMTVTALCSFIVSRLAIERWIKSDIAARRTTALLVVVCYIIAFAGIIFKRKVKGTP